jgi:hypothetical protein
MTTTSMSSLMLMAAVGLCGCERAAAPPAGQAPGAGQSHPPAIVQPGAPGLTITARRCRWWP